MSEIGTRAKAARDWIQHSVYHIIDPAVKLMSKIGITPNVVTTLGFLGNVVAAGIFVYAAELHLANGFFWVGIAGLVVLLSSVFDMVDGYLARTAGMCTTFGAFYDSVLDRYSELFTLGGICYYLMMTGHGFWALVTFLSIIGSVMVSYVRARAEGLGLECKVGLMQRPERVVVTSVGAMLCGLLADVVSASFSPIWLLVVPQALIAVLANYTAIVRILHCRRLLNKQ